MLTQLHTEPLCRGEDHHHLLVALVGGARLVEQRVVIAKVAGSNPVTHPKNTAGARFS